MNFGELFNLNALERQSYIRLAYIIHLCFPQAEVSLVGDEKSHIFTFIYKGEPLIEVNEEGVKLLDIARIIKFSGILEGSVETLAESLLRHVASRGIEVLKPERQYSINPIEPDYKQIQLNKCDKCAEQNGIRRIYVGVEDSSKFDPAFYYFMGANRTKDLGWFICIKCQSQFSKI